MIIAPRRRFATLSLGLLALSLPLPKAVRAQVLSPGKLAEAHRDLEGVTKCTACHEFGKRGVSNQKCLACHEPLGARIEEDAGFHATVKDERCGSCHKDHFGREFELARFDTTAFDHGRAGFELVEAHATTDCRSCHRPELVQTADVREFKAEHGALESTFLGLGTTCTGCHDSENPHRRQFEKRGCEECHGQRTWDEAALFDHNRTRYRLTGRHRGIRCLDCHPATRDGRGARFVRYTGIRFSSCESCHRDVHRGDMGADCQSCHSTAGWHRLIAKLDDRFDHTTTDFPLVGGHADAECSACHGGRTGRQSEIRLSYESGTEQFAYPQPIVSSCLSCHLDHHGGDFRHVRGGSNCENCHTEEAWMPITYDIGRHNRETDFTLAGAHLAVPCNVCHADPGSVGTRGTYTIAARDCRSCHRDDDPHAGQFGTETCESCHQVRSFAVAEFDHGRTRFPLDGEHASVACESCHMRERAPGGEAFVRYKPLGRECRDCHSEGS